MVISMIPALAHLKVIPTMVQGEQVAELEDVRVFDPLLALNLETVGSKP